MRHTIFSPPIRVDPSRDHLHEWVMVEKYPGEHYVIRKDLADRGMWGNVRQILKADRATAEAAFAEFKRKLDQDGPGGIGYRLK